MNTTDCEQIDKRPDYVVASTANFISITEKFVRENFMDPETALMNAMQKQKQKMEAEGKDPLKEAEQEQNGREYSQKDIDEKGFYKAKKETIEAEKITHGTFYMENGKIFFGSAEKREPVSYSNWYAGNVDPEQMERHKNLLDRQHFGGPTWENRKMPKSVLDETFQDYVTGIEQEAPEKSPKELGLIKEDAFEKVKR